MKKINNYIRYLLILILLKGIKVFAQTSNGLSQVISQAQQEASGLSPFFNLSSTTNTTIIKDLINTLGSSFLGFAIPFLFVFGVFTLITYLTKKEINRPLLLIYFIIDLLVTIFYPAILILLAIILAILLLLFGFYKLFYTVTGNTIGGITGAIITPLILYVLLTNGTNIIGFLFSSAFYILLFIFFIFIFIYGYKLSQSSDIKKLKKLIYHIQTPQDAIKLRNDLKSTVGQFKQDINQLKNDFRSLVNTLQTSYLGQQLPPRNINPLIRLLRKIRDNIKAFIKEYENYKRDLDILEADINRRHKEPLRSYLLKILEKEGKEGIEGEARAAFQEYQQTYRQILRSNRYKIINLARRRKYKRTIDNIFNDMESILHSFNI
ncbi:MAG: hypothetical protein GU343_00630 [Nanoarchaeota archaeon]|jgi:hypothetical protein|nr:hypothetical protein [Nanoarchaeota archaeon]